jgi:hypothetical protein
VSAAVEKLQQKEENMIQQPELASNQNTRNAVGGFMNSAARMLGAASGMALELVTSNENHSQRIQREVLRDKDAREHETLKKCGIRHVENLLGDPDTGERTKTLSEVDPAYYDNLMRLALEVGLGELGVSRSDTVQFSTRTMGEFQENSALMGQADDQLIASLRAELEDAADRPYADSLPSSMQ